MKSVFWWRKPEYPEETTNLRPVTADTFHTYGLCPVRGLNLGRSGVKQSELRRNESGALAHRATAVPLEEEDGNEIPINDYVMWHTAKLERTALLLHGGSTFYGGGLSEDGTVA